MRIVIVGAGPIGLEAALAAVERGHEVTVFERGRVAENVRDWGHVRLFSTFGMNTSERGRGVLRDAGLELPVDDALLTGSEFVEQYLNRLRFSAPLRAAVHEETTVVSIGRSYELKRDFIGQAERSESPFILLLRDAQGERRVEAECVVDASGTYPNHGWLGSGGVPCPGELGVQEDSSVRYDLRTSDVSPHDSVLVVGGGYSAATNVVDLATRHFDGEGPPSVTWVTRRPCPEPMTRFPNDSLPERDDLAARANALAARPDPDWGGEPRVEWLPGHVVQSVDGTGHCYDVRLQSVVDGSTRTERFSRVYANVGYKPDRSIYEELQVHECYASQGPIKLAASLLGETSGDCLAMASPGPDVLRNPEPNFFILGSKSYGRDSRFLLRTGLQQVEDVFGLIEE